MAHTQDTRHHPVEPRQAVRERGPPKAPGCRSPVPPAPGDRRDDIHLQRPVSLRAAAHRVQDPRAAARAIVERADREGREGREGRETTSAEEAESHQHLARAKATKGAMEQERADMAMKAAIHDLESGLGLLDGDSSAPNPRVKAVGGSTWGDALLHAHRDGMGQIKALNRPTAPSRSPCRSPPSRSAPASPC